MHLDAREGRTDRKWARRVAAVALGAIDCFRRVCWEPLKSRWPCSWLGRASLGGGGGGGELDSPKPATCLPLPVHVSARSRGAPRPAGEESLLDTQSIVRSPARAREQVLVVVVG